MSEPAIQKYLSLAYLEARTKNPDAGRRQLKLEVISRFWQLSKAQKNEAVRKAAVSAEPVKPPEPGPDPLDIPNLQGSRAIGTRGVIVRTHLDPDGETAWVAFSKALEDLERTSLANMADSQMESDSESEDEEEDGAEGQEDKPPTTSHNDDAEMEEANSSPAPALTYESDAIFIVVDPAKWETTPGLKDRLSGASNISLLRLFNDASIALAPKLPADAPKRIKPGHRLIDEDEYQEVYEGARLWVWDQQSAKDQTLRLISPRVFAYGDATGDSWRAKATHMWDLQLNLDIGMRIDFSGGAGVGWSMNERARNLKESTNYV